MVGEPIDPGAFASVEALNEAIRLPSCKGAPGVRRGEEADEAKPVPSGGNTVQSSCKEAVMSASHFR